MPSCVMQLCFSCTCQVPTNVFAVRQGLSLCTRTLCSPHIYERGDAFQFAKQVLVLCPHIVFPVAYRVSVISLQGKKNEIWGKNTKKCCAIIVEVALCTYTEVYGDTQQLKLYIDILQRPINITYTYIIHTCIYRDIYIIYKSGLRAFCFFFPASWNLWKAVCRLSLVSSASTLQADFLFWVSFFLLYLLVFFVCAHFILLVAVCVNRVFFF